MSKSVALIQIHLATLLMGLTGLFGKFLEATPLVITGGRTLIGSLALFIVARSMGASLAIRNRRDWLIFAASGALLAIHWLTFFRAIQVSTVAIGLLAYSSFPLFVTFLEPLMFRERLRGFDIVLAAAVVAGLAVVTPAFDTSNHLTQGVLWGVLSGLACASLCLLTRVHVVHYPPLAVAFHQQGFAAIFLLPALLFNHPTVSGNTMGLLILLGVVFTAIAQWLFVASLRHIRAQTASVLTSLEPVYGIVFAILLLGEMPSPRTLLGGLLICSAVFGATLTHVKSPPPGVLPETP